MRNVKYCTVCSTPVAVVQLSKVQGLRYVLVHRRREKGILLFLTYHTVQEYVDKEPFFVCVVWKIWHLILLGITPSVVQYDRYRTVVYSTTRSLSQLKMWQCHQYEVCTFLRKSRQPATKRVKITKSGFWLTSVLWQYGRCTIRPSFCTDTGGHGTVLIPYVRYRTVQCSTVWYCTGRRCYSTVHYSS